MTDTELNALTVAHATQLIARKKISPRELIEAVMSRIERLNPDVRAFITVMKPEIPDDHKPPLFGVPISVKDLYDTEGIRTTAGSKVYADRTPSEDATAIAKLKLGGAVIVGKANLHEFAYGVTTINPHYGTARNPWNRSRICGGSSGGSASAVALGLGLASLGTDTGGSIRIPAALCGIVGLKPTYGRVSLRGVIPLSWSLDHAGPMTRTVEDAAILMEIIAGYDSLDPYCRDRSVPRYTEALTGDIKGTRVGIPDHYFYEEVSSSVDSAIHAALHRLEKLGAEIIHVDMPQTATHRAVWSQIASPEAYSYHEVHLQRHAALYGSDVRGRLEAGSVLLSIDYVRAQRVRTLMKDACKKLFEKVDVIVTPTTPIAAPRIEDVLAPWGSSDETAAASLTRFTRYFNIVGLPAISVPCGFTDEGLPIGMQIAGKAFDESMVLRVAHAYEQDARWFERRPEL
jgi:aspartyl-tRNA(Asn)/glutamyl-tRNA(Gln) amidotransferase subunit A